MPSNGKLCRICWNTEHWRRPSGTAATIETGSYVSDHGFGHEEWLFNFEWMIEGYRFAFLQPINKFPEAYVGTTFPILLYTITPDRKHLAVALIEKAYIPTKQELQVAHSVFEGSGWIKQMREDLARISVSSTAMQSPEPWEIANVRFRPEDVRRFDPMSRFIPGKHGAPRITNRYMPFDWNGSLEFVDTGMSAEDLGGLPDDDPQRSETLRQRAAQQGTVIDPKHVRMQNRLFIVLKHRHESVAYEENFIDLIGRDQELTTYYELKTDPTARMCIRNAVGQLLDYSLYNTSVHADRLVVVGEAPATLEDQAFLKRLRTDLAIPIYYGWFSWEISDLVKIF